MPGIVPPLSRINDSISISGYTELYKLNLGLSERIYAFGLHHRNFEKHKISNY